MDITPLKKEQKQEEKEINNMETAEKDDIDDLEFNHLHLTQHHLYKRTIEGSPMITGTRKRVDLKSTPDLFRDQVNITENDNNSDSRSSSSLPFNLSSSSTTPSKESSLTTPPLTPEVFTSLPITTSSSTPTTSNTDTTIPTTGKPVPQKVFVITSGTDTAAQHTTTPGHQENAQRTALLSGTGETQGCLYRPSMAQALVWAPSVQVPSVAASMADILR